MTKPDDRARHTINGQRIKYLKEEHWSRRQEFGECAEVQVCSHFFGTRALSWLPESETDSTRQPSPDPRIHRTWLRHVSAGSTEDLSVESYYTLPEHVICAEFGAELLNLIPSYQDSQASLDSPCKVCNMLVPIELRKLRNPLSSRAVV